MLGKTHFSISESMIITVVGAVASILITVVPAWKAETEAIVGILTGAIVTLFPLINAQHAKAAATVIAAAPGPIDPPKL